MESTTLAKKNRELEFSKSTNNIFVFETDALGRHETVSAKYAVECCGAQTGQPRGLWGNSFAISTHDENGFLMPLATINKQVQTLLRFAAINQALMFFIYPIACGPLQYREIFIAPMFSEAGRNCILPSTWKVQQF